MAKNIAIILSGCGFQDGSEIHESVLSILHTVQQGAVPHFFAPDSIQTVVVNHKTGEREDASRNVLAESARIARGDIKDIKEAKAEDFDAIILPGGFGAAMNLCDFGSKGTDVQVNEDLVALLQAFHEQDKPIGAICIAPVILAKVFGQKGVQLTIGTDAETASKLTSLGVKHVDCQANEHHVDHDRKLVTTPAYMLGKDIA